MTRALAPHPPAESAPRAETSRIGASTSDQREVAAAKAETAGLPREDLSFAGSTQAAGEVPGATTFLPGLASPARGSFRCTGRSYLHFVRGPSLETPSTTHHEVKPCRCYRPLLMTAPANSAQVETRGACGVPTPCTKVPCARRLLLESLEDRRLLAIDFYAVQNLAVGSYLVCDGGGRLRRRWKQRHGRGRLQPSPRECAEGQRRRHIPGANPLECWLISASRERWRFQLGWAERPGRCEFVGSNNISILRGNGDGTFQAAATFRCGHNVLTM